MSKEEIIKYCLSLPNTFEDYPFPNDSITAVMKHSSNKKWFAVLMEVKGELYLNIKTDPNYSDILRNAYEYIIPAYHMNKELWNTVIISKNIDTVLIKELIEQSYELTQS